MRITQFNHSIKKPQFHNPNLCCYAFFILIIAELDLSSISAPLKSNYLIELRALA